MSATPSTTRSARSCFRDRLKLIRATALKQASLALSIVLLALACQGFGAGATETLATITPSPTVVASTASPGSLGMCGVLSAEEVASVVAQPAAIEATSSNADTCTFVIGNGPSGYFIALRREQGFEGIVAAKEAFAGGEDVLALADQAYWSPEVDVLWFLTNGDLFAVQLINFRDELGDALAVSRAVAETALPKLSAGT